MSNVKYNGTIYGTDQASEVRYGNSNVADALLNIETNLNDVAHIGDSATGVIPNDPAVLNTIDVVDNLGSSAAQQPLSANQGRVLKESIENIDFSPLEAAINDNSMAISENNVAISKNNVAIESLNTNVNNNSTEINNIKSKKISFIDTSRLLARITTKGSSYTATEPCFAMGFIQGSSSAGGCMSLDGEIIIWSQVNQYGQVWLPLDIGQTIFFRSASGDPDIRIYALK